MALYEICFLRSHFLNNHWKQANYCDRQYLSIYWSPTHKSTRQHRYVERDESTGSSMPRDNRLKHHIEHKTQESASSFHFGPWVYESQHELSDNWQRMFDVKIGVASGFGVGRVAGYRAWGKGRKTALDCFKWHRVDPESVSRGFELPHSLSKFSNQSTVAVLTLSDIDVLDEFLRTSGVQWEQIRNIDSPRPVNPNVCSPPLIQFKVRALPDSLDTGKWLLNNESGTCHRQSPDCRDRFGQFSCQDSPS